MAYRYLFGWAGGLAMLLAAYLSSSRRRRTIPTACSTARAITAFALARRGADGGRDPGLGARHASRDPPTCRSPTRHAAVAARQLRELRETVRNRAFVVLMLAGVCAYTNQGISYALSNYSLQLRLGVQGRGLRLPDAVAVRSARSSPSSSRRGSAQRAAASRAAAMRGRARGDRHPDLALLAAACRAASRSRAIARCCRCCFAFFIAGDRVQRRRLHPRRVDDGRRGRGFGDRAPGGGPKACSSPARSSSRNAPRASASSLPGSILRSPGFPDKATPGRCRSATIDRLTLDLHRCIYLALALVAAFCSPRFPFGRAEHEARLARLAGAPRSTRGPLGLRVADRGIAVHR